MKSHAMRALVGLALLALGAWQTADAALCMCHPSSCLLINSDNNVLNEAELHCPKTTPGLVNDLMIVRYIGNKLSVNSFGSFPNLTALEIFQGVLNAIEPGAFDKVPNLTKIIIRNNHLDTLEDYTFRGLDGLEILFIISSELTTIAPNALDGLKNLTHLTLTGNRLTQLPENLFASTPALETISLAYNQIGNNLPAGLFGSVDELIRLDLSHNQLTSFDFPHLKVTQLQLQNNSLTSLFLSDHYMIVQAEVNRIAKLTGSGADLSILLLSENALTDIGPIAQMVNLTKLSLSSNPLQPNSVFNTLRHLDELLLSHTNIQITEQTFANMAELKLLDLSYNNLTELDFSLFSGLIELQTLIVAFNKIAKINFIEQREYLPKLRVLEICGNGWNTTYLTRMLDHMRMYKLKADMHGLSHTAIFKGTFVELCATGVDETMKPSMEDDDYSEDISDILEQDIAKLFPSSSPSTSTTKGTAPTRSPTTPFSMTTAKMNTAATSGLPKPSPQPSVRLATDTMTSVVVPQSADDQPSVVSSSPLWVTFQVIVYTFAVFGFVALGVVAYYMRQRRNDVRRISSLDEADSVRLV
uniref:Leucine rich immune protein (Coil-less) n=1 Tax=Anopheles atroparvus TaxID=41427 RepID=A0AAG5CVC3_ANOAO